MPKYKVHLVASSTSCADLEVEADNPEKAEEKALAQSAELQYRQEGYDYEVDGEIEEIKEK